MRKVNRKNIFESGEFIREVTVSKMEIVQIADMASSVDKYGVTDGARTHDNRNHNPGLYQLSYSHHKEVYKTKYYLARPTGFEPVTLGLEGRCSIQMSYGRRKQISRQYYDVTKIGRGRGIRTPDTLVPNQVRYQTALYPESKPCIILELKAAVNKTLAESCHHGRISS
jgi:hypothetical protein